MKLSKSYDLDIGCKDYFPYSWNNVKNYNRISSFPPLKHYLQMNSDKETLSQTVKYHFNESRKMEMFDLNHMLLRSFMKEKLKCVLTTFFSNSYNEKDVHILRLVVLKFICQTFHFQILLMKEFPHKNPQKLLFHPLAKFHTTKSSFNYALFKYYVIRMAHFQPFDFP